MRQKNVTAGFLAVGTMAVVLLVSAACGPPVSTGEVQDLPTHTPTRPVDTPTSTPEGDKEKETAVPTLSSESAVTVEPGAEKAVAAARADLVERLGVTGEQVVVRSVEAVEWPDASLGCPQPGMAYAQVITPGFRLLLGAEGQTYEYHTDQGRVAVLYQVGLTPVPVCPTQVVEEIPVKVNPTVPMPSSPGLQKLVMEAMEDLSRRLSIEVDRIDLVEIKAVVWPDSSLGCPQPGMVYTQVQRDGALVRLRVGKRVYNYHSGGGRPPFLCEQASKGDDLVTPPGSGNQ